MPKATTIRFTDEVFARLDQASARTGMPVNSIVVAACLEWLAFHVEQTARDQLGVRPAAAPRWATLRRALGRSAATHGSPIYPFEQFTKHSQELLILAQGEAQKHGHSYIGTEHLLLACCGNPEFHAAKILSRLGIDLQLVESKLESVLGREKVEWRERIVPTERVKAVIEIAFRVCSTSGSSHVATHHLLLALSEEGNGIAAHLLKDLGAPLKRIEHEVGQMTEPEA